MDKTKNIFATIVVIGALSLNTTIVKAQDESHVNMKSGGTIRPFHSNISKVNHTVSTCTSYTHFSYRK